MLKHPDSFYDYMSLLVCIYAWDVGCWSMIRSSHERYCNVSVMLPALRSHGSLYPGRPTSNIRFQLPLRNMASMLASLENNCLSISCAYPSAEYIPSPRADIAYFVSSNRCFKKWYMNEAFIYTNTHTYVHAEPAGMDFLQWLIAWHSVPWPPCTFYIHLKTVLHVLPECLWVYNRVEAIYKYHKWIKWIYTRLKMVYA